MLSTVSAPDPDRGTLAGVPPSVKSDARGYLENEGAEAFMSDRGNGTGHDPDLDTRIRKTPIGDLMRAPDGQLDEETDDLLLDLAEERPASC